MDRAVASLAKLKKRAEDDDDAEAWYRLGVAAGHHDSDEAIEALRNALDREPNAALAAAIGQSLETLGDPAAAEHAYRKALELDPALAEAHGFLGALLCRHGQKSAGLRSLTKWADLAGDPAAAHAKLGLLLLAQDEYANAADHFQIAIALDPEHLTALKALGRVYEKLGNREGRLRAWQAAHELEPDESRTTAAYGAALSGAGRHAEAIEILNGLAKQSPAFWEIHLHLGRALLDAGRPEASIDHLAMAARMAPAESSVHVEIGRVLEKLDRKADATAAYERAIALDPRSFDAHRRLGLLLRALGRTDDAVQLLVRASALAPGDERIRSALAEVLEAKKAIEGIGGSLSVIALPDLVQFLHSSRASGVLNIRHSASKAAIRIAQGNLQEVLTPTRSYTDEAGIVTGLMEMLRLKGGAFDFDHCDPTEADGVDPRFALMEAMRRLDEEG
jgi:tetratricopeptide (TPR) repeat protein